MECIHQMVYWRKSCALNPSCYCSHKLKFTILLWHFIQFTHIVVSVQLKPDIYVHSIELDRMLYLRTMVRHCFVYQRHLHPVEYNHRHLQPMSIQCKSKPTFHYNSILFCIFFLSNFIFGYFLEIMITFTHFKMKYLDFVLHCMEC